MPNYQTTAIKQKGDGFARWRSGRGIAGAKEYCRAEAGYPQRKGTNEADAWWRRRDSPLPGGVLIRKNNSRHLQLVERCAPDWNQRTEVHCRDLRW